MQILFLIWLHFLADFILQSDKVAVNKSKYVTVLGVHSLVYLAPFFLFGFWFAVITGALHFIVDYVTSKLTTYFYSNNERHWFFVTIGADQAVHLSCLILTFNYFWG